MTSNKDYANFVHCLYRLKAKALNLGFASYFCNKMLKNASKGFSTHYNDLILSQMTFVLLRNTNTDF